MGEQALELADRLGLDELKAHSLNNLSVARSYSGDHVGSLELLERAAAIARAERSPELLRILNNMLVAYSILGQLRRHSEVLDELQHAARELGDASLIRFTRGSAIPWTHYVRGRWDEAVQALDAFVTEADASGGHRLLGSCLMTRAQIRLARGDDEGALADAERAATEIESVSDPYFLAVHAGTRADLVLELGRRDEAVALADRAVELSRFQQLEVFAPPVMRVLHALGRGQDLLELAERMGDIPYAEAARLWGIGDVRGAADVYASLELMPVAEAVARLAAGRDLVAAGRQDEADVELLRAIELYRPVGAVRYVAEAEALLSSAADATAQPG